MHLLDLAERLGPFWAAYQARRRRDRITENPEYVPPWFLRQEALDRVVAARVGVEHAGRPDDRETEELFNALRVVEERLRSHDTLDLVTEQLVCGLLGAQAIETERERQWAQAEAQRRGESPAQAELGELQRRGAVRLVKQHLRERGITTSAALLQLQAEEREAQHGAHQLQWAALDELAEEVRASSGP